MIFNVQTLRFDWKARDAIFFPPAQAAIILRGALGMRLGGDLFSPSSSGCGPSGLADWPRPFVIRARHLDGVTVQSGEVFHFDLNVFSAETDAFIGAFSKILRDGIGPGRGSAELAEVQKATHSIDLHPRAAAPSDILVNFLSPTELKHEGGIAVRPEFPILFARIRDRVSTLRALYGPGPLPIDFEAIAARSASVRMANCEIRSIENSRRSTRTGQSHPLGGFVGHAIYRGDLAEFLPWLEAAQWTGVGRQTVWGKGEIEVAAVCQ